jgi:hypothetical protein
MTGPGSAALAVFEDHLARIEAGLGFVEVAVAGRKQLRDIINWGGDRYAVDAAKAFLAADLYPEELLCNSCYLSSVAAFEEFLRATLDSAIRASVSAMTSFDDMGRELHAAHMKATGRLLARCSDPPQQAAGVNFFEVCRRLGTCMPGSKKFEINSEALWILNDSLSFGASLEMLVQFRYVVTWDLICANRDVQARVHATGTREAAKALRDYLEDMTRQRNRIAHTGTTASEVTVTTLREHLALLLAVSKVLTGALGARSSPVPRARARTR